MSKVEYLYGKYATKTFVSLAIYFCYKAKSRLKLHLKDLLDSEGFTDRSDRVDEAIDFWSKRLDEFKGIRCQVKNY